jgi:hypothetical protein
MRKTKLVVVILILVDSFACAQSIISSSFELRYFTTDLSANGETDFKGETEWMDTEQRILFLDEYARYASNFFENPGFNKNVVTAKEIQDLLKKIKAQPLTNIRSTVPLNGWRAYGYRKGQDKEKEKELTIWQSYQGTSISDGSLLLDNAFLERRIDTLSWRFRFETKVHLSAGSSCRLLLGSDKDKSLVLEIKEDEISCGSGNKTIRMKVNNSGCKKVEIEGDFTQKRFNLYVNEELLQYYIPMMDTGASVITHLSFHSAGKVKIDDLFIFNHVPHNNPKCPYLSRVILDENFEKKPGVEDWHQHEFNDDFWNTVDLPAVHGGLREKGEDYYLRKKLYIGDFKRAILDLETLDPGGEVWINGEIVAVINTRHPQRLDITEYLRRNSENLIAVRIKAYYSGNPMTIAPDDRNIGWFLGRTKLLFTDKCMIEEVLVHTEKIEESAVQSHSVTIQYNGVSYFDGSLEINYYPWYPEEGSKVATVMKPVQVRPRIQNRYIVDVPVEEARLWSCELPNLYKVEVILKDRNGQPIDDYITTTGIRTVGQGQGNFYFNGKPEILKGVLTMGFRTPIETISKYHRCAPWTTIAEEMLAVRKMGANMLRMHVHAEQDTTDGINDPRYAELADQMGITLAWTTSGWMHMGEAWNIDFKGYPQYMKQVYNHPSIVMWEASNIPNRFKKHELSDTEDFIKKTYQTIYSVDQSRLITLTTHWPHTHYANYDGTIDYQGNKITPVPEFNVVMVTRGAQDSYTGYGRDWSYLRKSPNNWVSSCLAAKDKAYFNMEHEESIAQPNWDLCKGKPWYLLQSYEWDYDKGSIGRRLTSDEWKASQGWQAFSAWESMKKQLISGYAGFCSWCCLYGGPCKGTYKKALIDELGHPKLAYYINKMAFQKTWAGSNNVDVAYGPGDKVYPVIYHRGEQMQVNLEVNLEDIQGTLIEKRIFKNIELKEGIAITQLDGFRFKSVQDGTFAIRYIVYTAKK